MALVGVGATVFAISVSVYGVVRTLLSRPPPIEQAPVVD